MAANVTVELQKTLIDNPTIEKVYFDKTGRHYFYAHLLQKNKDDKDEPKLYGQGEYSHSQIIPGILNVDKTTESIAKGVQETLIVEEMTREEVLSVNVIETSDKIFNEILNLPADKLEALKAMLKTEVPITKGEQKDEVDSKPKAAKPQPTPNPAPKKD